jgi:hypothetical protein
VRARCPHGRDMRPDTTSIDGADPTYTPLPHSAGFIHNSATPALQILCCAALGVRLLIDVFLLIRDHQQLIYPQFQQPPVPTFENPPGLRIPHHSTPSAADDVLTAHPTAIVSPLMCGGEPSVPIGKYNIQITMIA